MKRKILNILPIIIMGTILCISVWMFNMNKNQTYERVRKLKEAQVQIVANEFDMRSDMAIISEKEAEVLRRSVESINEQPGVYCYLFDKDCNLISNFSKSHKHTTGEKLIKALREDKITKVFTHEYHGYIDVAVDSIKYRVYWQGVPSGTRNGCDYFMILSVAKDEVQENEAIGSCKVMIAILTITLGISLYGNLYAKPVLCEEESEEKSGK